MHLGHSFLNTLCNIKFHLDVPLKAAEVSTLSVLFAANRNK